MAADIIVVGAGVTGLASAVLMAQHGRKVVLVEQARTTGPLIRRFRRGDAWCDAGLHYSGGLGPGRSVDVLMGYLGMPGRLRSRPMDPQAFDRLWQDGREYAMPVGFEALLAKLKAWFPGADAAAEGYVAYLRELMQRTPYVSFDLGYESFTTEYRQSETLQGFLASRGAPQAMIDLLGSHGQSLYGAAADEAPAFVHGLVMGPFFEAPRTLEDGGDEVLNAFDARLSELGVEVVCGDGVAQVESDAAKAFNAVALESGRRIEAGACIFTAHPKLLAGLIPLGGAVKPAYFSRLKALEDTEAAFSVYLDVAALPPALQGGNEYHFYRDEQGRQRIFGIMVCPPAEKGRRALCLSISPGAALPSLQEYRERGPAYRAFKQGLIDECLGLFRRRHPEAAAGAKVLCAATPRTYEDYTRSPDGSAYGVKHSARQISLNPITSIRHFYLAGQGIHFPGLMGTLISAFLTGSNILGMQNLWEEVTQWRKESM
jgi:all-trans-retinol 13,14-reductase